MTLRAVSALLLAAGLTLGGTVAWQLWGTDLTTAAAQRDATDVLEQRWRSATPALASPAPGTPIARLTIPRLGPGWSQVVLEGVDEPTLTAGPGHYPGTAGPGQIGNMAIAGHRVTHGAPLQAADTLRPCDPINVETATAVFTYRVLPVPGEPTPCALDNAEISGRQIVDPTQGDVIAPVPGRPAAAPDRALLTLTTCHPRFSARQRLVVHAVLVGTSARVTVS